MNIKEMTRFNKFLTPSLITVIYWIGIIGIVISSIGTVLTAFSFAGGGVPQVLSGIFLLFAGLIFWRVICEGIMLSFRIYDRLTEIKDRLSRD